MRLTWLADRLRAAWPLVEEHPGWEWRTLRSFFWYRPKGIINHHTAGSSILHNYPNPPYWPNDRLETKCNVTIRPDGVIAVLNSGWAYDSGMGAPEVLDAVKSDQPLPPLSGLSSKVSGNAHFIDAEVQHLGDGGPIAPIQREALIVFNAVVCEQMGWDPRYRVIGHYEWAPDRKIDPYWDRLWKNTMPGIRTDTTNYLEAALMYRKIYEKWTAADLEAMRQQGLWRGVTSVWANDIGTYALDWDHLTTTILAAKAKQGSGGGLTESQVKAIINKSRVVAG